jgi:periplasmic divalent cation tolerance protein
VNLKSSFKIVLVTAPLLPVARKLAGKILAARLAACVNLLPGVESHYWWQGKLERGNEILMLIKTTADQLKPLRRLIKRHHPYETPEFIALPVTSGSRKYLKWIEASVQ